MGNNESNRKISGSRARVGGVPRWLMLAFLSGCLGLTACHGGPHEQLKQWVKRVRAQHKGHVPPLPEFKPYETFTYNDKNLRDPFKPFLSAAQRQRMAKANTKLHPPVNHRPEALEAFSLDSLKFVGTLEKKGKTWALIQAPDHTVHRVSVGNYMGQNYGRVTRITENRVNLHEIIPNGLGGWVERNASMALK